MLKLRKVPRTDTPFLKSLGQLLHDQHDRDDMAIPSYLHSNPLIPWIFWRRLDAAFSLLGHQRYRAVLDYGCGTGTLLPALSSVADRVIGCDLRPALAREFVERKTLRNVQIVDLQGFSEIAAGTLDVVISADVLEHVEDLAGLVNALHEKMAPGAELIISGPTENPIYKVCRKIAGFSGEYHVRNIYDIKDVIETRFKLDRSVSLPLSVPGFCLFRVYRFLKQ